VEGIVITGGCALNILVNQLVRKNLTMAGSNDVYMPYDVYMPPAPNDEGLSVGGLFAIDPPSAPQALQYLGFRLWDEEVLEQEVHARKAQSLESLGGVEFLADLLSGGAAWFAEVDRQVGKPIVAVVRGRQELGPRALGHRSLFAVPDSPEIRERMNRLKHRKWFRPVSPIIADEALEQVSGRGNTHGTWSLRL